MTAALNNPDDLLELYWEDYQEFAADCITIRDHNTSSLVNLQFNAGQRIMHTVAERQKADIGYVRQMLLKARRFGGATYIEGRFYHHTSLNPNRNTFIVGHEQDSTTTLFRMAKLMQERNPIAPSVLNSNAQELRFDTPKGKGLKSEYRLATAKNVEAGRSQGIHYLHLSEEAFWNDPVPLLTSLMQCVPPPPADSEVFRESTGNGYGNTFQEDCFRTYAEGRYPYYSAPLNEVTNHIKSDKIFTFAYSNPDTDWILVFIPWFIHSRYSREFDNSEQKRVFKTKIEQKVFDSDQMMWVESEASKLYNRYGLSLEQLHWREYAIANYCRGSEDTFKQEYPASVEEAFLSKGSNIYSKAVCDSIESLCRAPILVGDIIDRTGQSKIKPNPHGKFSLWVKPEKSGVYFLTVDPGGGIKPNHEKNNKEPDPTCIDVWDRIIGEQCAQWHGHVDYGMIGDIVYLIGRLYGFGKACVELMNHGYTVVKDLRELEYPMFEAKPGEAGWLTTSASKPRMVDDLGEMARNGDLQIRCKETVSEMRTYVEKNGKFNAASGCHDDRVMSAGMASQMMTLLPRKLKDNRKRQEFKGFTNIRDRNRQKSEGFMEVRVG